MHNKYSTSLRLELDLVYFIVLHNSLKNLKFVYNACLYPLSRVKMKMEQKNKKEKKQWMMVKKRMSVVKASNLS